MNEQERFKSLLEYFVAHLEWMQNRDAKFAGYEQYIAAPWANGEFRKTGKGERGDSIQNLISDWSRFRINEKTTGEICITVKSHFGKIYYYKTCYLNWKFSWSSIRPVWDDDRHIVSLYISSDDGAQAQSKHQCSISDLGLYDGQKPNAKLSKFLEFFKGLYKKA